MITDEQLNVLKACLQEACGKRFKGIVLYGSEARGTSGPDSDIDVLVLLDGPIDYGRDLRTCIHAVYPLIIEWERPISPEPVSVAEYEAAEWPLYKHAHRDGIAA